MMSSALMRWSGMAAILAGALLIVSMLLTELVAEGFIYLFALVALPGLHARQDGRSGLLGLIGFVAALIGAVTFFVLFAVVFVAETFFGFDPDASAVVGAVLFVAFIAFLVGIVLFGIATARAGVFPRGAALLLALGLLGGLVIDLLTGAFFDEDATQWGYFVGLTVFAVGLIWLGYTLRSERGESAAHPSRVR
jgi:hypothetical protein